MEEKQTLEVTQLVKSDAYYPPEEGWVRRKNDLMEGCHNLSLNAQRLLVFILSKMKPGDTGRDSYDFTVNEFARKIDVERANIYRGITKWLRELEQTKVVVPARDANDKLIANKFYTIGLISNKQAWTAKFNASGDEVIDGAVEVFLHEEILPYVIDVKKRFKDVWLEHYLRLNSRFAQVIYDQLKAREFKHQAWKIGRTELRRMLGIEDGKFELWGDLRRFVLERAQTEIKQATDIEFDLEYVRRGQCVTHVIFHSRSKSAGQRRLVPGSEEAAIRKEILSLGVVKTECDKILATWWRDDRERVTWHLKEVKRQMEAGGVLNPAGLFKAAVTKDWRPKPNLAEMIAQSKSEVVRHREEFERGGGSVLASLSPSVKDSIDGIGRY